MFYAPWYPFTRLCALASPEHAFGGAAERNHGRSVASTEMFAGLCRGQTNAGDA